MTNDHKEIIKCIDNIILPECDDRKYRAIELKNGMSVFLVSDKETKISGCCLTVNIGAMYSPKNLNGLAHFLEHMLFCGTKKYPDVDEYQKFISSHGGKRQGITTRSSTTYYFEIKNEVFTETLDRFSSFFTEPLFCKNMTEKEVSAIENEFHLKYHSDERVRFHLLAQVSEESHPLNCFTTGNKETLLIRPRELNIDVHKELLKFYSNYYSSNIMSALLYSNEDINTLERYSIEYFSRIPSHDVKCFDYYQLFNENPPYTSSTVIGKIIRVIPYETDKRLKIYFPLPPLDKYQYSCAHAYIDYIIGHKGEGSISSILRNRKLAINASFKILNEDPCAMAQFGITLTDEGYNNISLIIEIIFNYLMLYKSSQIIPEIVEEFIGITKSGFRYQPKLSIHDLFSLPAKYLKYKCNFEEILSSGWIIKEFSEEDVYSISKYLNIDNFFILLSSQTINKEFEMNPESFKIEHYYNTKYKISSFDNKITAVLNNLSIENAKKLGLMLPTANPFVSTDFTIVNRQFECKNDFLRIPELIKFDDIENKFGDAPLVWFKSDTTFNSPHSVINMRLVAKNIQNINQEKSFEKLSKFHNELIFQVFGELLDQIMYRCMHKYSSEISSASLSYNINFNARTNVFVIEGIGLSHKLNYLITLLFDNLFKVTTAKEFYDEAIILITKDWKNKIIKPNLTTLSVECISESLSPHFYNKQEKLEVLENFTYELFSVIRLHFLTNCEMEGLIMGNYLLSDAKKIVIQHWENLKNFQNNSKENIRFGNISIKPFSVINLNENIYTLNYIPNKTDRNGCWLFSFFLGKFTVKKQVMCDIIIPYITSEIFAELRTRQQLAYVVKATQVLKSPVIILGYYIQSSEFTNALVLKRLLEFHCQKIRYELKNKLDENLFIKLVDSTIQTLSSSPKSIFDEYKSYLHEINEKSLLFDIRQRKIEILEKLTHKEFIEFYESIWNEKSILTEIRSQIDETKKSAEISSSETPSIPNEYHKLEPICHISRYGNIEEIYLENQLN